MIGTPTRIVCFEMQPDTETRPEMPKQEWLQITAISDVGNISREPKQKILRLGEDHQRELFELLKLKFGEK